MFPIVYIYIYILYFSYIYIKCVYTFYLLNNLLINLVNIYYICIYIVYIHIFEYNYVDTLCSSHAKSLYMLSIYIYTCSACITQCVLLLNVNPVLIFYNVD